MRPQRYKSAVASSVKTEISKIKKDKESLNEFSDKLVTLIYTWIGKHVTTTGSSVGAATSITQGDIDTHKPLAIDAAHQL